MPSAPAHEPSKNLLRANPRKNLPSRKRTESTFVLAFSRAYLAQLGGGAPSHDAYSAREFRVSGFGIADFIWVTRLSAFSADEGSGLSLRVPRTPRRETLFAFEMKMVDWRKALAQAYRYRYFADRALVVLPPIVTKRARKFLATFKALQVGLWAFDKRSGKISKVYTPRNSTPLCAATRERAVASLAAQIRVRPVPRTARSLPRTPRCDRCSI
jgi:hypothetical protein